jgi:hypothetical protein
MYYEESIMESYISDYVKFFLQENEEDEEDGNNNQ